jgi:hypothetical protein
LYTKSTSHSDKLTKRNGGGGILIFRLQKFGEKLSILTLIHARAKTFDLSTDLHSSLDSRPWGEAHSILLQYTNCKTLAIIVHS